jgi:CheY-like chemotaxis protein
LGGKKKKPTVIFECEDTGPGIPPENFEFLFRPFRESQVVECIRVDDSGTVDTNACLPKMSNSGLGLYSVANQITSIGGEYGFRPRAGINDLSGETGAVFWFSIPLIVPSKSKDKSKESKSHAPCDGTKAQCGNGNVNSQTPFAERKNIPEPKVVRILSSKKMDAEESALLVNIVNNAIVDDLESNECRRPRRTLVIDDSIVIRKSVGRALSRLGYEVDQATNGLEGLQKLQQNVYDVVLCDFLMPVMDGLDCVQQYRDWESTHRPWISQYIVGISAHASPSDIDKGKQAGMNDFKSKPVTLKHLKELESSVTWVEVTKKLDEIDNLEPSVNHNHSVQESKEGSSCNAEELPYDSKSTDDTRPICLIGEPENENFMNDCVTQYGWRAVHVHDGEDALRLLKMRNWDAVFVANDISRLNGIGCVARFRDWESENRVTRQNNVILLSSDFVPPPDQTIVATYPLGFDGALGRPVLLKSVEFFLNLAQTSKSDTASSKSIVAR